MADVVRHAGPAEVARDAESASGVTWAFDVEGFAAACERAGWTIEDTTRSVRGRTAAGQPFDATFADGGAAVGPVAYPVATVGSADAPGAADEIATIRADVADAVSGVLGSGGPTWPLDGATFEIQSVEGRPGIFVRLSPT